MSISSYAQLIHPGGWFKTDDLALIRTKVAAGEQPWISGWNAIKDINADTSYEPTVSPIITDREAFSRQGHAAYVLAIKWVATGDIAYANTVKKILDAWVNTVQDFDIEGPTLRLSVSASHMANAAEIIAWGFNGEAGWPASSISNARTWFRNVVYPYTSTGGARSLNWGTSCVAGNMSMAVFCDDMTMFNDAIDAYKFGFTDTNDGCAGVTQYIINDEGQCFESSRDQVHTQGGIAHLVEPALIAWNQGVDLVSYSNDRLVAGMEYTAKYNLGNNVPFTDDLPNPCNIRFGWVNNTSISNDGRGDFSPMYYLAAKLFKMAGKEHPYTEGVIQSTGYAPEFTNTSHPGMGTMCFIYEDYVTDGELVHIRKLNAPNFAIDGDNGGDNGQNIKLWSSDTGNENQQWLEIDRGNGYYSYQKKGTNYCIDGNNGGVNGQNVYIWTCDNDNQNQHWEKVNVGGNSFKLVKRNLPRYALNGGSGGANNQNIDLGLSSSTSQDLHWIINPINVLSTNDVQNELSKIAFYPNPVVSKATLKNAEGSNFRVYDINGRIVFEKLISKENEDLNLNKLSSGIYYGEVHQKENKTVLKIVKK